MPPSIIATASAHPINALYIGGKYLLVGASALTPGQAADMRMQVKIPYGVVGGSAITGTLTIYAS